MEPTIDEQAIAAPARDPEDGLRDLRPRDWVIGSVMGSVLGAALWLLAPLIATPALAVSLAALGFGMGLLAYLDYCTQLIRNRHNLAFGIIAAGALFWSSLQSPGFSWIQVALGAGAVFSFLLVLTAITGFMGGGDIKLSPVPGAILAAVSPLAAALWLLVTFILCLVTMIVSRLRSSSAKEQAMAPFMAAAIAPALLASNALLTYYGLA